MDERAKRREARIRRILQNSQGRLEQITGVEEKTCRVSPLHGVTEGELLSYNEQNVEEEEVPRILSPSLETRAVERAPPKKLSRFIVVSALAGFINFLLVLLEKGFEVDVTSSNLNKIFLPLFTYEMIEFCIQEHAEDSKLFLLCAMFLRVPIGVFKYLTLIISMMEDVMVYFFVFVCCDIIKVNILGIS